MGNESGKRGRGNGTDSNTCRKKITGSTDVGYNIEFKSCTGESNSTEQNISAETTILSGGLRPQSGDRYNVSVYNK